ncbi:undecaprenyl-diphosphate phosphatase [Consotaella salsifontis]|uniref:Undecaprenyl-diphosphatase n=1 Tax=Consotaella salsifontis TaxID=1365950 RepID=A0A1T4QWD9_9HYPH|nr:undecaprenyl-diphosphate phosphatase [Consotaella salsifontis]SKA08063.1 Undecaprenyl-diphosphatase [Consotaella salsifontis]
MSFADIFDAIVLGLTEGLTEFIPVSSTAHLLLVGRLLGFQSTAHTFEVLIQFGAILAVLVVYAGKLWQIAVTLPSSPRSRRFTLGVLVAFLPAAFFGALLHDAIKVLFEAPVVICIALIVGGVILLFIDRMPLRPRHEDVMNYPLTLCLGIGLFQCLAMIPGTSRSGATIVGALFLGADKRSAAEFSFFLAIPTMLGAFVFDLYKSRNALSMDDAGLIAIGFVVAFLSALVVVKTFIGFVGRHGFAFFGWWRIVVGLVGLVSLTLFA